MYTKREQPVDARTAGRTWSPGHSELSERLSSAGRHHLGNLWWSPSTHPGPASASSTRWFLVVLRTSAADQWMLVSSCPCSCFIRWVPKELGGTQLALDGNSGQQASSSVPWSWQILLVEHRREHVYVKTCMMCWIIPMDIKFDTVSLRLKTVSNCSTLRGSWIWPWRRWCIQC